MAHASNEKLARIYFDNKLLGEIRSVDIDLEMSKAPRLQADLKLQGDFTITVDNWKIGCMVCGRMFSPADICKKHICVPANESSTS